MIAAAVTIAALAATFSAEPATAKADCRQPRDFAQLNRCFLAQFACIGLYFGIDRAPDYPRALKCFEDRKEWNFVVVMYVNGEGAPRDPQKAETVLKLGQRTDPDMAPPEEAAALQKAIDKCKLAPHTSCPRVDYCRDAAYTTQELEICDAIGQFAEEARLSRTIAGVRRKLSAPDRAIFDRAVAEFKAYQLEEMQRAYDCVVPGSFAGLAGAGQAGFVRDNFLKLIAKIQTHQLKPASVGEYKAADDDLSRVYSDDYREHIKQGDSDQSVIQDYNKTAPESQHHWFKLRDLLAELATSLYRYQAKSFDPAVSIKTAMTKFRIAELRYNPLLGK
ncbi:MAG: hypothetical protein IVW56_01495 [Candidatus Binataceae bacterium]|nr:hypothetical protein [Candidatus Binataceae bacterium]